MKITIIILSFIIGGLIAIILMLIHELRLEIDNRQYYQKIAIEKIKENDKMKRIIYSQRVNLKHLNKKLNNKI